jgi:hypothetical protein
MERIAADIEAFHLGLGDLDAFLVRAIHGQSIHLSLRLS